jgi:hypothetical protein
VVFGGTDDQVYFGDTWEFDGIDWHQITTLHSPPAMGLMSMVFDSRRNTMVLYGGQDQSGQNNDTWEYDGSDWSIVGTPVTPPRAALSAMAYDAARDCVVLVPYDPDPADAATWEYDGSTWLQVTTSTSPTDRWAHAMVYDSFRHRIILYGGYGPDYPGGSQLDDTWEYDGHDWRQVLTPTVPPQREQHAMAYDSARALVIMFGGVGSTSSDRQTWEYIGFEEIFADGFESGDTSAWSLTVP